MAGAENAIILDAPFYHHWPSGAEPCIPFVMGSCNVVRLRCGLWMRIMRVAMKCVIFTCLGCR